MTDYYVDNVTGNDGNAGTSEGAGNAWATIQYGLDTIANGDTLYVKAAATYTEVGISTSAVGTFSAPRHVVGYTSTITDEGKVTVTPASGYCIQFTGAGTYTTLHNFKFNGGASAGFYTAASDNFQFYNCEFSNNSGDGMFGDNTNLFINCEATGNTGDGIDCDNDGMLIGCIVASNTIYGSITNTGYYYKSLFYGVAAGRWHVEDTNPEVIISCTFDGENQTSNADCIKIGTSTRVLVDNIIYDGGRYGVQWNSTGSNQGAIVIAYNLVNSNGTSDYENVGGYGFTNGYHDVTTAPAFTNEGSDDYTLGGASPAIDAGVTPGGVT